MPVLEQVLLKVLADYWIYLLFFTEIYCIFFSPLQLSVAIQIWVSQVALVVKNLPANSGDDKRYGFDPWVWKIPWRRKWQPTPVFLPGESHGQEPDQLRSLGLQRVRQDWSDLASRFSSLKKKKKKIFHRQSSMLFPFSGHMLKTAEPQVTRSQGPWNYNLMESHPIFVLDFTWAKGYI